jgi:Uma2 family endonuclease
VGWKPGADEFGPDLIVVPLDAVDQPRYEAVPPLVVEVVSTNRATDLVVKVQKYARAGAPRYWIVDLQSRTLLSLVLVNGVYEVAAQLDDDNPVADLDCGLAAVHVDLGSLFR